MEHFTELAEYGQPRSMMTPDEVRGLVRELRAEGDSYDEIFEGLCEMTAAPDPEPSIRLGLVVAMHVKDRTVLPRFLAATAPRRRRVTLAPPRVRARSSLRSGRPRAAATASSRSGDGGDDGSSDGEPPPVGARQRRVLRRHRLGVVTP